MRGANKALQHRRVRFLGLLLVGLSLTGCQDAEGQQLVRNPVSNTLEGSEMPGDNVSIAIGDSEASVLSRLGQPGSEKALKNSQPDVMGARVIEYNLAGPVATLTNGTGQILTSSVQFVLDGSGKILRILANPNAFNGDQPRTLRGSPFLAEQVQIPTGSIQRAPRQ